MAPFRLLLGPLAALAVAGVLHIGPAWAAEAQPAAEAPAQPPSLAEMVGDAGTAQAELLAIEQDLAPDAELEDQSTKVSEHLEKLDETAELARERIEQATQLRQLTDLENRWLSEQLTLESWRTKASGRALAINEAIARIDELIASWEQAREEARELGAPLTVIDRIGETLASASTAREKITAHRAEALAFQAELAGGLAAVADLLARTKRVQQSIRGGLLGADSLPIWTALQRRDDLGEMLERGAQSIENDVLGARSFLLQQRLRLAVHAVFLVLSIGLMLILRPRAARWAEQDESVEPSARVLARPYAAAVLIAVLAAAPLYPKAPSHVESLFLLAALAAALRLIPPLLESGARPILYTLAGFFVVDLVRDALAGVPLLARVVFELELSVAIGVLIWFLRAERLSLLLRAQTPMPLFVFARRLALVLLGLALAGSALGYVALSRLLGNGVLRAAYAGVCLYAGYKVLAGILSIFLRARALQHLNLIRDQRQKITQRLIGLTSMTALAVWAYLTLGFFGVRNRVLDALGSALSASLNVGELEISLGSLVAFVVTLVVSLLLARFLRQLLDIDVLPRLSLRPGVPYAISTTGYYVLVFVGFFSALAAAGLDLTRFSLLAGALGVGIGFGLQHVVNDFASGLILLYERPIKTGDTIEIGTLIGEVRRIGIRSSTIRTFEGAEVVVPNARLTSTEMVNWTLSDRNRRIEVNVRVRYGTDPERVIGLLLEVARADERILAVPKPTALFLGFGESSLDFQLRAWTAHFSTWVQIRSDLTISVSRALADAGIEIPLPQRDLHLHTGETVQGEEIIPPRGAAKPTTRPIRSGEA